MADSVSARERAERPEIRRYAEYIVDAPDEWSPHFTRSELLPMAQAYLDVLALVEENERLQRVAEAAAAFVEAERKHPLDWNGPHAYAALLALAALVVEEG